ncbi:MAG: hypothetical protein A2W31_06875 [Planctomycetes bacterium RBG_16_64_10]|nr:MAG: hypothetical protein A2W31_06875 [Planctomycetes bacterium RBG_16_64_10]
MSDLAMTRGDTLVVYLTIMDADAAPINITAAAISFMAKRLWTDADSAAVCSASVADGGIVVTNGAAGLATLTLTPDQTANMAILGPPGYDDLVCDVRMRLATDVVATLWRGQLRVYANIAPQP